PAVQSVTMVRQGKSIVAVQLTFTERLDRGAAENLTNFVLRQPGKKGRPGKGVALRSAQWDGAQAVRLSLKKPLKSAASLELTIVHPELLVDIAGNVAAK